MGFPNASVDLSSEIEVDAFRRLFPLRYYERHLQESIRPDARPLGTSRDTTIAFGAVASADGSALVKIGSTTMLAAIKMEVMAPSAESPNEGSIVTDFHMPPICSPLVRPGRPAEAAPVVSKQLSDTIISSNMIDLKELSLVIGKAAWMAYLDIYCLDADGSLFDAALFAAVSALSHCEFRPFPNCMACVARLINELAQLYKYQLACAAPLLLQIPIVSLNDDGRIVIMSKEDQEGKSEQKPVNKEKRKLMLKSLPFSLTSILYKNYILADPTAEEESIMETLVTVVLDSSSRLVSYYKPGGSVPVYTSAVQDCVALTRQRVKELKRILDDAMTEMEIDQVCSLSG